MRTPVELALAQMLVGGLIVFVLGRSLIQGTTVASETMLAIAVASFNLVLVGRLARHRQKELR